jgi:hypothetical protein
MDSVLPGILAVALLVLGSLVIGRSGFTSFNVLGDAWRDAEERSVERLQSDVSVTSVVAAGSSIDAVLENHGQTPVVDFSRMDVVVQYSSGGTSYVKYLQFTTDASPQPADTWRVVSITNDVIDPRVLNTGESMTVRIELSQAPDAGSHWLQITTELGISAASFFTV